MEEIKKEFKLVFNSGVARRLLKMGVHIADIKADRANPDKTVFVFKCTPEFEAAFAQINKEIAEAKAEPQAQKLASFCIKYKKGGRVNGESCW